MLRFCRLAPHGLALLLCGFLVGCGGGSNNSNMLLLSGIQGQATRGPITPAAQQGQPNEAPLPDVVIVVQRPDGTEVARQTTDSLGDFKIGVAPGTYQVVGLSGSSVPPTPPAPQSVTVPASQYVTVNVSYDTGIR